MWAKRIDWLCRCRPQENDIPSLSTFGRLFELIDAVEFATAFCHRAGVAMRKLERDTVVVNDGKTSHYSERMNASSHCRGRGFGVSTMGDSAGVT